VDLWRGDRVRPKWGIYRSLSDRANLRDCYLLINRMRAYQFA
jgi:chitin-binding protein